MISLCQARPARRRGRGSLSLVDFVHRSPMKISPWYVRLAPTQGFLLSLCAKAFASAVTLLQDFLCLFTRLSSAYPPFAFVLCSSSPWSPILGGLGSLNRIICVTWRILINWYYPFFPLVRFTYSLTLQAAPYGIWRARSTLALAPRVSLHARFRACFVNLRGAISDGRSVETHEHKPSGVSDLLSRRGSSKVVAGSHRRLSSSR